MFLEIITPTKKLFSGEVNLIRLPGSKGSFEILKDHAPIVSSLEKGTVKIVDVNKQSVYFNITGGVIECRTNKIIVLADSGEAVH